MRPEWWRAVLLVVVVVGCGVWFAVELVITFVGYLIDLFR